MYEWLNDDEDDDEEEEEPNPKPLPLPPPLVVVGVGWREGIRKQRSGVYPGGSLTVKCPSPCPSPCIGASLEGVVRGRC